MIGEQLIAAKYRMSAGSDVIGPRAVASGVFSLGVRCDGNAQNPDVDVAVMLQFSVDGGATWRDVGGLAMNARTVAADLQNFPGSAYTLLVTHDGSPGAARILTSSPQPANFAVYVNF